MDTNYLFVTHLPFRMTFQFMSCFMVATYNACFSKSLIIVLILFRHLDFFEVIRIKDEKALAKRFDMVSQQINNQLTWY